MRFTNEKGEVQYQSYNYNAKTSGPGGRITKSALKGRFVEKVLEEEATIIKQTQEDAVDEYALGIQSGQLRACLKGHFSVDSMSGGPRLTMSYVHYLRVLEINPPNRGSFVREGLNLYNKIVFGRLYNDTKNRIAWGYHDGFEDELIMQIKQAMSPLAK